MEALLANYPDGTGVVFRSEDHKVFLEVMGYKIGVYYAPDNSKASETLQRIENGDGELVKRIFADMCWLPGVSVEETVESMEASFDQTSSWTVVKDLSDYSLESVGKLLEAIQRSDLVIEQHPTIDDPILEVTYEHE